MKKLLIAFGCFFLNTWTFAQDEILQQALFDLPDVHFEKITTPTGFQAAYELRIKQAIDHKNPDKGHFYQRVFLSHRGFDAPTLMCTEGYQRPRNRVYELSALLAANQLDIEHRYFGESMPDQIDYEYLTLEQATADLHHINELFRKVYKEKWISTGISKGGQTTIFYRYFYPNDVDVSIPYVAPLNLSLEDERIYHFLDTVGTAACREAIVGVQQRVLQNYDSCLTMVKWFAKGAQLKFKEYLTLGEAFEYTVLEYPFSFWQWGTDCSDIPDANTPLEEVMEHLLKICDPSFFADGSMKAFASHYYQAGSQMGYYGYETEDVTGLLRSLPEQPHPSAIFMPEDLPITFNGELPKQVYEWLQGKDADRFIYIYGSSDTWSATAVPVSDKPDAKWFFLAGKDHAQARIKNMSAEQRSLLGQTLNEWLDIELPPAE